MMFQDFFNYDVYELLDQLNGKVADLAKSVHLKAFLLYIAGAVLAVLFGFFGYKLVRFILGLGLGSLGYCVGIELFHYLQTNVEFIKDAPAWTAYVLGGFLALVFLTFGFAKFPYAVFTAFAFVGYYLITHYVSDNVLLGIGGALLLALISSAIVRTAFILLTSAAGGFIGVSFFSAIFPEVEFLKFGTSVAALLIACGAALIFFAVQLATARRKDADLY